MLLDPFEGQGLGFLQIVMRVMQAAGGQLSPAAALEAAAIDFEEITIRLGRERQRESYRTSLH